MVRRAVEEDEDVKPVKKSKGPRTNMERVRQVAEGFGGDGRFLKIKEGNTKFRILPSNQDDELFYFKLTQHYGFRDGDQQRAYPCMLALGKSSCPACQAMSANEDDVSPEVKKACQEIRPRSSYLMNVLDRASGQVMLYSAPKTVIKEILGYFSDPDYGDLSDPEAGHDVTVVREGKGKFDTKYSVRVSPKASAVAFKGWEKEIYDLEKEAYRETPDRKTYIRYLMDCYGDTLNIGMLFRDELKKTRRMDDEEDEEEEEEKPRKKAQTRGSKAKAKLKVVEDEEEDEEELDDEDDEEDDE